MKLRIVFEVGNPLNGEGHMSVIENWGEIFFAGKF